MNTLKVLAATAAMIAMGAQADNVNSLDLSSSVKNLVNELPVETAQGFEVKGPLFTREVIGYDYNEDEPIYGDIKGVVTTRQVVGFDYNEDEAIYGEVSGVAVGLNLTDAQREALFDDNDDS